MKKSIITQIEQKKWTSLTQVKQFLENNSNIKILDFNGALIQVPGYSIGLYAGSASVRETHE